VKTRFKFINFDNVVPHPRGVWVIRNNASDKIIGKVEWYPRWRMYVADFDEFSIWSSDCLNDVAEFIKGIG